MPEDPEQVLPKERGTAVGDVEEVRADTAVEVEEDRVRGERRQREQQAERRGEEREAEERRPVQRHPGCAQLEDGDDEVRRGERRRDPVEDEREAVEVDVPAR